MKNYEYPNWLVPLDIAQQLKKTIFKPHNYNEDTPNTSHQKTTL